MHVHKSQSRAWYTGILLSLSLCLFGPRPVHATTEAIMHTFNSYADGATPQGTPLQGADGNIYGVTTYGGTNGEGTVFCYNPTTGKLTTLHSFTGPDGYYPISVQLAQDSSGTLYGTTVYGGANNDGEVFKLKPDGSGFAIVHSFAYSDGYYPYSGVVLGSDGYFYGTTVYGGTNGYGVVFQVSTDGSTFNVLHNFANSGDGYAPYGGVAFISGGNLFGTSAYGGANTDGLVYELNIATALATPGTGFTDIHDFSASVDGAYPEASLTLGSDGNVYGTTTLSGLDASGHTGYGTIFQVDPSTGNFTLLHTLSSASNTEGANLYAPVTMGSDGNLYGAADNYGPNGYGTVFQVNPTTANPSTGAGFTVVHSFSYNATEGGHPYGGVILAGDGALFGTTQYSESGQPNNFGTIYSMHPDGSSFATVFDFGNGSMDGRNPYYGSLLLASDGNYYGTTPYGGLYGYGTLYKLTPTGEYTILYNFNYTNGGYPYGDVAQSGSVLYGTTWYGGFYGSGTAFSYNLKTGGYTLIYSFGEAGGSNLPAGVVVVGSTLYGVSKYGGQYNQGTVFKLALTKTGVIETVLHSFGASSSDGAYPIGQLLYGADKALYGTTYQGGANGYGTVFRITTGGALTILHNFSVTPGDGYYPVAGLVQDSSGVLYGTASGAYSGTGMIYSITTSGTFTDLHDLNYTIDGGTPYGPLLVATDGNLYGTTLQYGASNVGTVFEWNTGSSVFSTLYSFAGSPTDGANPYSGLIEGLDGNLYGTTYNGGNVPTVSPNMYVAGTIYQIQTNLPVLIKFSPGSRSATHIPPMVVTITGSNLSGATSVMLGTTAQTITFNNSTTIKFQLNPLTPPGTYHIVVTLPSQTLTSKSKFTVKP